LLLGAPKEKGAEWISLVDAVAQMGYSVYLPDKTSLERRYSDFAAGDRIQYLPDGIGLILR
jgi:hypothetical protein